MNRVKLNFSLFEYQYTYNIDCYSTFENLSGELLLGLFEYMHIKEILQSFPNLNKFINSCIFDQRQQLHLHLDHQISSLSDNYSPNKVISLHIENIILSIDKFPNLKSLCIIHNNEREDECLNMVKQVRLIKKSFVFFCNYYIYLDFQTISTSSFDIIINWFYIDIDWSQNDWNFILSSFSTKNYPLEY